jgi:tetratricopeptide (TPR) repeat protein
MTLLGRLATLACVLRALTGFAQSPVPAASLAAEATDLAAFQRAVNDAPSDAAALLRLSQAYAAADQPGPALDAVERAFALSPDSVDILRARGTLATWVADYDRAQDSYRRLGKLQPDDQEVFLSLARVSAWGGRTDAAVEAYGRYLRGRPDAAPVWIELARTEAWRGNYAAALERLEAYQKRFGKNEEYAREVAAVQARASQPGKALETLEPMLRQHPDDYELNLTRTIALTMQGRAREASDALKTVQRLRPETRDTQSAERVVRATLASAADPGMTMYADSSGLDVQRLAPRATVSLASGATFAAGSEHEMLTAPAGSELAQVGGKSDARHDQIWVSAAQQFGGVNLRGRVGQARTAVRDLTAYAIGADFTMVDGLKVSVERNSGFFVVSPRTVGLGLTHVSHRAQLDWSPGVRYQLVGEALYQTLSDGNHRWEFTLSPRRSVARTERLNLDLGVTVTRLHTTTNFDHGYYDPSRHEFYAVTAYPYWKIHESVGLGLSLALGTQRDDFSPGFRLGGNATGEATFGIYHPWGLKVTGGATVNQRLGSGAFRGYGAGVTVIRRF